MRDHDELVNELRESAEWADRLAVLMGRDVGDAKAPLMRKAADAIEELLAENKAIKQSNKDAAMRNKLLCDEISRMKEKVPKWISVDERLPKKDEMVIVYYSWTGQSGTEYKEVSLATLDEMRYCGNKLLGWMPLPEPPKEVQDG